ncbi:methyltransferase domain-containing protein [Microlunatus sp. GCM10028923]|uniref:methyltransferase domain-containing protein n=1 Tax=Microlunatus sp. GCM10028923 TaxID=3273400 RepID=UPI00361D3111
MTGDLVSTDTALRPSSPAPSQPAVGDGILADTGSWTFAGEVSKVFVDHVRHSVPLYEQAHIMACDLSSCFVGPTGLGYELGSSTGQLLRQLATHTEGNAAARWIGIDREPSMTAAAVQHCAGLDNVACIQADITEYPFDTCDFVAAHLTMQFLPIDTRARVTRRVCDALRPGGAFFLCDKVLAPDARLEDLITTLHYRWKRRSGLSPEEILNKKESLLGVLQPITTDDNLAMLRQAGFTSIVSVVKNLCFEGFIAVK